MSEAFNNSVTAINATKTDPKLEKITNDEKLELYGWFKQATVGDNTTAAPWAVQLEAKAKWSAWDSHKGVSKEQAEKEYIEVVRKLLKKYNAETYIKGF